MERKLGNQGVNVLLIGFTYKDIEDIRGALSETIPYLNIDFAISVHEYRPKNNQVDYDVILWNATSRETNDLIALKEFSGMHEHTPIVYVMNRTDEGRDIEARQQGVFQCVIKSENYLNTIVEVVKKCLPSEHNSHNEKLSEGNEQLKQTYLKLKNEIKSIQTYLQTLMNGVHDRILVVNRNYEIIDVNEAFLNKVKYRRSEVLGRHCYEIAYRSQEPCQSWLRECPLSAVLKTENPCRTTHIHRDKRGRIYRLDISAVPVPDEYGRVAQVIIAVRSTAKRLELVEVLKYEKMKIESLIEGIEGNVVFCDRDDRIILLNERSEEYFEVKRDQVIGKPIYNLQRDDARGAMKIIWEAFRINRGRSFTESDWQIGDKWFNVRFLAVYDEKGRYLGTFVNMLDITEQKKSRERQQKIESGFMETQKLASIGMLAREMAHNLNSSLTGIMGDTRLFYENLTEFKESELIEVITKSSKEGRKFREKLTELYEDGVKILKRISNQADRMDAIIRDLMYKSRREQDQRKQRIDLNQLLTEEVQFLESNPRFKQVKKLFDLDESIQPIEGIYSDFSQSFGNIIKNAVEAMDGLENQELSITTRQNEEYIFIHFHDTGIGIAEEDIARIFEPFFTTKAQLVQSGRTSGTGLGLYSCQRLLEPYGVTFDIKSKPRDTTFTLKIPKKKKT